MEKILKQNNVVKKRIVYQETYKKDVIAEKEQILKLIKLSESKLFAVKAGKYNDGKEFITITIDNI
jgi:hypothetical protein